MHTKLIDIINIVSGVVYFIMFIFGYNYFKETNKNDKKDKIESLFK